jgi:hypothetical protein
MKQHPFFAGFDCHFFIETKAAVGAVSDNWMTMILALYTELMRSPS